MSKRNKWTVKVHPAVAGDVKAYEDEFKLKSPMIDLAALIDDEFMELKRLLAQSGGLPKNAYRLNEIGLQDLIQHFANRRLAIDPDWLELEVLELNYLRGRVWVTYCREAGKRLITIVAWTRFAFGTPRTARR